MKYILAVSVLILLIGVISCKGQNKERLGVNQISVDELKEFRKSNNGILLDVRTPGEIDNGFIEGAIFSNYYDSNFENTIKDFPKDKEIYIYCRSGNRSNKAASVFVKNGFTNVYNLKGGFKAWVNGNNKVVKNN